MSNIGIVLRDEISRLSRREVRKHTETTRKATAQHRRYIAQLHRKVAQLERQLAQISRRGATARPAPAADSTSPKLRFVAKGLRSHRERLGLSAAEFGTLVGVSANSVYMWEQGKATPRRELLARIAELRGIGKRDAAKRLQEAQGK